jgi:hypothetical protein
MAREQLSHLTYSELAALAARLNETAETIRNPALRADLHQAVGAISDLASLKFGIEEIAADCDAATAIKLQEPVGQETAE